MALSFVSCVLSSVRQGDSKMTGKHLYLRDHTLLANWKGRDWHWQLRLHDCLIYEPVAS